MGFNMITFDEDDIDLSSERDDEETSYEGCQCSNCMECLGLSWRDFM